jgi:hypothetical protein
MSMGGAQSECGWFGRMLDLGDSVPRWLVHAGGSNVNAYPTTETAGFYLAGATVSATAPRTLHLETGSAVINNVARRSMGPMTTSGIDGSALISEDGNSADLVDILTCGLLVGGASSDYTRFGKLRQMRYGPTCVDRQNTYDGAVAQTIYMGCNRSGIGAGIHLDQFP